MKKALLTILLAAVAGLVFVLIAASMKPDTFSVRRSIVIHAAPDRIAPHIVDFRKWEAWSPYEKMDLDMKKEYSGPARGTGAVYRWSGNSGVGEGRMEITGVTPSKITIKLDFTRPMEASNTAEFTMEPGDAATKLTWSMSGPNLFMGKIFSVFMDMDEMVGKDFETGLLGLKGLAEK